MTIATQGAGTQFLLPQLGINVGAKSALGAAINAGVSALASRATVSLINNKGDLGKVFKELGSSQFVKSLATSMLTAGLTAGLTPDPVAMQQASLSSNAFNALPFVERLQDNLVNSLVSTSVETAIQGGSFGDNLVNSLRNVGVNQLLAVTDKYVGDITDGANKLPVANLIAHTIVGGLAAEATGGKFVTGAAAGLASAIAAQSGVFKGLSPTDIAKVSQLIGGAAALLAGGDGRDVNQGAATSQSAAINNYLTHKQWNDLIAALKNCGSDSACKERTNNQYLQLSLEQEHALASCMTNASCLAPQILELADYAVSRNEIFADLKAIGGTSAIDGRIWLVQENALGLLAGGQYYAPYSDWAKTNCASSSGANCYQAFMNSSKWQSLIAGVKLGVAFDLVIFTGRTALKIAPDALAIARQCVFDLSCWRSVGLAAADAVAAESLGGASLTQGLTITVAGGKLAISQGTKLLGTVEELAAHGYASGLTATSRLTADELATGIRLEQKLGIKLSESSHEGAEYIDASGLTYDALGTLKASEYWNSAQFFVSIDKHLLKSNNYTVIDLTGFKPQQITEVTTYLASLPAEKAAKIIRIGF